MERGREDKRPHEVKRKGKAPEKEFNEGVYFKTARATPGDDAHTRDNDEVLQGSANSDLIFWKWEQELLLKGSPGSNITICEQYLVSQGLNEI